MGKWDDLTQSCEELCDAIDDRKILERSNFLRKGESSPGKRSQGRVVGDHPKPVTCSFHEKNVPSHRLVVAFYDVGSCRDGGALRRHEYGPLRHHA